MSPSDLASTSHVPSATALAAGLQARHKQTQQPTYWIQISGATCYAASEISRSHFGHATSVRYDDIKDCTSILSVLKDNPKRVVDQAVLSQSASAVRTALIIGPLIYGVAQGPGNTRSIQAPEIARVTLKLGHGIKLNEGANAWSNVHVRDIAGLICVLVRRAVAGEERGWNEEGVYNVENGEMVSSMSFACLTVDYVHDTAIIMLIAYLLNRPSEH